MEIAEQYGIPEAKRMISERDAVLRRALEALEDADQIDTDMRDAINQIKRVLNG
jgi:hypothetical protein